MIDEATLLARADAAITAARRAGADAADALATASASQSVTVRLGALEDVDRSEAEELSLRVFVGRASASVGTSDLSERGLAGLPQLAERAVSMARHAPEDPHSGLAPAALLATGPFADLDLADETHPSPDTLREEALEAEDAMRAVAGVTNSEGGSASHGLGRMAIATSEGFAAARGGTRHAISASAIGGEGAAMQRDYDHHTARHHADRDAPATIGRSAGERAVARLDPARPDGGTMPVLFDRRVSASLIGHLIGAMNGAGVARGSSFLLDREKEALFPDALRIVEEPHRRRGLRSRAFDGEGLPTVPRALVEDGRITGWLTNLSAARQLGVEPTGHATPSGGSAGIGVSNVRCEPGESRDALIAGIARGVLVTELIGQGVNPVTGDYSRGASGFAIENGAIAGPVAGFTIAGNLIEMFARLVAADDLELRGAIDAPSLLVERMAVAAS